MLLKGSWIQFATAQNGPKYIKYITNNAIDKYSDNSILQ